MVALKCLAATKAEDLVVSAPPGLAPSICNDCPLEPEVPVSCCATCFPCLFICNANGITDDDWDLLIDGVLVGKHVARMEYRATVVLPQSMVGKTINGIAGRGCTVFTWIHTPLLDAIRSRYLLVMRLAQKNGSGNYGTVQILCAKPEDDGTVTIATAPGGQFTYANPTPYQIGVSVRYPLRFRRA